MNTSRYLFFAAVVAAAALSCTKAEIKEEAQNPEGSAQVTYTIKATLPDEIASRVSVTPDANGPAVLAWQENDQLTLIREADPSVAWTFAIINESINGKDAEFNCIGPALGEGPYTIFYHPSRPLSVENYNSLGHDGQVQSANGDISHLKYGMKLSGVNAYQGLVFSQEWATAHGSGTFSQNSVLQLLLKLPHVEYEIFSVYVHDEGSFKQTLWFNNGSNVYAALNAADVLKAYMMVPEVNLTGDITVRVETSAGAYEKSFPLAVSDWTGGSQYTIMKDMSSVSLDSTNPMQIHAKSAEDLIQFGAGAGAAKARFRAANITLESDICFPSSYTFSTSYPDEYTGTIDGNNHSISNLKATVPLFGSVNAKALIKDLTLDETCSFAFTHKKENNAYVALQAGTIGGYLRGKLEGVTVKAAVSLTKHSVSKFAEIGGLIGRMGTGSTAVTMDDCHFAGSITVPSDYVNASQIRLGGLAGNSYNSKNIIKDSSFDGTIDFSGVMSNSTAADEPNMSIGGIAGKNNGTISNCTTTDHPTVTVYSTTTATIVNKSKQSYGSTVGGIAGINTGTVSGCTNNAKIHNYVLGGSKAVKKSISLYAAGIVGYNTGALSETNYNKAPINASSNPQLQKIAGVVAFNNGGTVSGTCKNNGAISVITAGEAPNGAETLMVGGILAHNTAAISGKTLTNESTGVITVNYVKDTTITDVSIGGVIGYNTGAISGESSSSKTISNAASITQTNTTSMSTTTNGFHLGGIVGSTTASVENAVNSGKVQYTSNVAKSGSITATGVSNVHIGGVIGKLEGASKLTLSNCQNNAGEVYFYAQASALSGTNETLSYTNNYVGGIVALATSVDVSGCTNSGYVHGGRSAKKNSMTLYLGGILGRLSGTSSISECSNTGVLRNDQFNNTTTKAGSVFEGGIVGFVEGSSANRISISSVTNTVAYSSTIGGGPRRGYGGGVAGYAEYTDITGTVGVNTNSGNYESSSSYFIGGIVGWAVNTKIKDCTYNGATIETTQLQNGGGIVAILGTGSSIDGCYSKVATITGPVADNSAFVSAGAIAGKSVSGAVIKNSHYKSTGTITGGKTGQSNQPWQVCGDTNWEATEGSGNNSADI